MREALKHWIDVTNSNLAGKAGGVDVCVQMRSVNEWGAEVVKRKVPRQEFLVWLICCIPFIRFGFFSFLLFTSFGLSFKFNSRPILND